MWNFNFHFSCLCLVGIFYGLKDGKIISSLLLIFIGMLTTFLYLVMNISRKLLLGCENSTSFSKGNHISDILNRLTKYKFFSK